MNWDSQSSISRHYCVNNNWEDKHALFFCVVDTVIGARRSIGVISPDNICAINHPLIALKVCTSSTPVVLGHIGDVCLADIDHLRSLTKQINAMLEARTAGLASCPVVVDVAGVRDCSHKWNANCYCCTSESFVKAFGHARNDNQVVAMFGLGFGEKIYQVVQDLVSVLLIFVD